MPKGTQRDALIAIRNWIEENMSPDFDDETRKRIQRIYEGTEEERKGWEWVNKVMEHSLYNGSETEVAYEELVEPEDGAELPCAWVAESKSWHPLGYGWPSVLHKTSSEGMDAEDEY
jgi:hypothetical protein